MDKMDGFDESMSGYKAIFEDGYKAGRASVVLPHPCDRELFLVEGSNANNYKTAKKTSTQDDVISHPAHYTQGIECMDYIESHRLNYARGNIIKYVTRAGLKDASKEVEDLEKARWYLDREIERVKKAKKDG